MTATVTDADWLRAAIELSYRCPPTDSAFNVGARCHSSIEPPSTAMTMIRCGTGALAFAEAGKDPMRHAVKRMITVLRNTARV